jgi:hypothetical protein
VLRRFVGDLLRTTNRVGTRSSSATAQAAMSVMDAVCSLNPFLLAKLVSLWVKSASDGTSVTNCTNRGPGKVVLIR